MSFFCYKRVISNYSNYSLFVDCTYHLLFRIIYPFTDGGEGYGGEGGRYNLPPALKLWYYLDNITVCNVYGGKEYEHF